MSGKLIIIEAGDGSGKATQTELLYQALKAQGQKVMKIQYPDYDSPACEPVKMYLKGDFGKKPEDVNAYTASLFFAVDRFASYKMKWQKAYEDGYIILADRYTTSNMVHQAVKIQDLQAREKFLAWLWDTEFVKMGLPVPDRVIFLDVPPEVTSRLITARAEKDAARGKDIHEQNKKYLAHCYQVYCDMAEKYQWQRINCVKDGEMMSVEEIHQLVLSSI